MYTFAMLTTPLFARYARSLLATPLQVSDKQGELQMCYRRIEQGEPPSELIEQQWNKLVNELNLRQNERDIVKQVFCNIS